MVVPAAHDFSRTELDKLEQYVKSMGAKGLARAKVGPDGSWQQSPLAKFATPEFIAQINAATAAKAGDLSCFNPGEPRSSKP